MRFAGPPQVDDADLVPAQRRRGVAAERADDRGAQPEARRSGRGDDRAAANRRDERGGPQLFAAPGQVRQAHEDQVLKRFADREQIDARHARKV